MMMKNVAILSAVRTPIAKGMKGGFRSTRPDDLCALVIKEAISRASIHNENIEDVIVGCAMPEGEQGMNVARIASIRAGLPFKVAAATVNRFCASGLHAVADVAKSIVVGQINIGIGAGVESMTMIPMGGYKPSANPDIMNSYPDTYLTMGLTAERVAKNFDVSRKRQDEFALHSHEKAFKAQAAHLFVNEIIPVSVKLDDGSTKIIKDDEGPRKDTTLDALASLKPAFMKDGSVTAGNSSPISDGAAALLLANADYVENKQSIKGYFRAFVTEGVDPAIMGIGPVLAIKKLFKQCGLKKSDIGVFEINEAFAAQAVYCIDELGLDHSLVNPLGGAIALGHPLGCSGARLLATMLEHMKRNNLQFGVCSMCIGGGMGAAGLIERV